MCDSYRCLMFSTIYDYELIRKWCWKTEHMQNGFKYIFAKSSIIIISVFLIFHSWLKHLFNEQCPLRVTSQSHAVNGIQIAPINAFTYINLSNSLTLCLVHCTAKYDELVLFKQSTMRSIIECSPAAYPICSSINIHSEMMPIFYTFRPAFSGLLHK